MITGGLSSHRVVTSVKICIDRVITCIALHISKRSVSLSERKKLFYKIIKSNDSAASAVPCRRKEQTTVINM